MPKHRLILAILAVGLLAALIITLTRPREPSYQGQGLSHWVHNYVMSGFGVEDEKRQSNDAIKRIGTNAIPCLMAWLRHEEPPWKQEFYQLAEYLPERVRPRPRVQLCYGVPAAFRALGPEARCAVPELTKLANDTNHLIRGALATTSLGYIPLEDVTPLVTVLTNPNLFLRGVAWDAIRSQGTNAAAAIPLLVQDYKAAPTPFKASTLGAIGRKPELVVPALTNGLADPSSEVRFAAAEALAGYGPQASSAAPAVLTLLTDPSRVVRIAATNALLKIAPEAVTNAPPK
jgi:hypothetical protein